MNVDESGAGAAHPWDGITRILEKYRARYSSSERWWLSISTGDEPAPVKREEKPCYQNNSDTINGD